MSSEFLDIVRAHYPQAQTTVDSVDRFFDILHGRFGLVPSQVALADSVCSDDVNSVEYPRRAFEMVGPFKLGGLDGFPFAGVTGMGAFAGHVPDDGAIFIYHAPHIGVGKDGSLGTIVRSGQTRPSGCCGACRAALAKLQAGQVISDDLSSLDYQQNTLEQILLRHRERVLRASTPLKEATEVIQEAIAERIDLLTARTTFKARYLIVMGAVLINGDHGMGSFTAPRRLVATDLRSGDQVDLLADLLH
ncbi:MAG: hypothetical protein ACKVS7_02400 [Gemmatimonadaceae bacterium]